LNLPHPEELTLDQPDAPVSSIPNLGPAAEALFAAAGITSAAQLRAIGADAAYLRVLQSGAAPHFIMYYVLVMGLQGRPWNDCQGDEKHSLRLRFDALKAQVMPKARSELEAAFDFFGVRALP
jgi:DNA transformation protein